MDTNVKDTNTKSDVLVKILLVVIAVLLLVLVLAQIPALRSQECIKAREQAKLALIIQDLDFMYSYESDVYGSGVDNINQQIFRVSEYQYLVLEKIALYQQALLSVITKCQ